MTPDKPFDCVEMKHQAAEAVQTRLAPMSREERIQYFRERTQELRALQQQLQRERKQKKSA